MYKPDEVEVEETINKSYSVRVWKNNQWNTISIHRFKPDAHTIELLVLQGNGNVGIRTEIEHQAKTAGSEWIAPYYFQL